MPKRSKGHQQRKGELGTGWWTTQYGSGVCGVSEENGASDRDSSLATKLAEEGASLRESFPSQPRVPGDTSTQQIPKVHTGL